MPDKEEWYEVALDVNSVQGLQVFCVKAKSKEDAYQKYKNDFGNFYFVMEELEVQGFEEPNTPRDFVKSDGPPNEDTSLKLLEGAKETLQKLERANKRIDAYAALLKKQNRVIEQFSELLPLDLCRDCNGHVVVGVNKRCPNCATFS